MQHIHILGICGTFMGSLAILAKQAGFRVTGCDANVYPPMSTQLQEQGIELIQGFGVEQLALNPDIFVIGNVVSRGNALMEEILNRGLRYTSGPQWLGEHILKDKWVLAVAGTHGKTTTATMLAWILEHAGYNPSYLIGGVPHNFATSARLTDSMFFVIEADEYDTAFFDKRSKFVHYHPKTVILNNLEFDHADIFKDLAAIQTQFHHLVRIIPSHGKIIANHQASLEQVIDKGLWSEITWFNQMDQWSISNINKNNDNINDNINAFDIYYQQELKATINWNIIGEHNQQNGLAAVLAAHHIGITLAQAANALNAFTGVKRRMEIKGVKNDITVYDDFAHHPTAIATTVHGLKLKIQSLNKDNNNNNKGDLKSRLIAVLEPRSNTMKMGAVKDALADSLIEADHVFIYGAKTGKDAISWDLADAFLKPEHPLTTKVELYDDFDMLLNAIKQYSQKNDHILVMSNGSFNGIHQKILDLL